eukprot:862595_1
MIGMGKHVVLKNDTDHVGMLNIGEDNTCCVYFENIAFDNAWTDHTLAGLIRVNENNTIYIKDCTFKFTSLAIWIKQNAKAHIRSCTFICGAHCRATAIELSQ